MPMLPSVGGFATSSDGYFLYGGMWDVIVIIPDHCLSILVYFSLGAD